MKLKAYSRLLSNVFNHPHKFSCAYLQWLYAGNPVGEVMGTDAFYKDELVAHHAAVPVNYVIRDSVHRGLLAINNATLPAHQGKGLLKTLAATTFAEAAALGFDFVVTVTNQNSTPAYLKKFGFKRLAPLEAKIGFGRLTAGAKTSFRSDKNEAWINWRLANPVGNYFAKKDVCYAPTHLPGVAAQLHSADLKSKAFKALPQKSSVLTLWLGLASQKKQKGFFVNIPERFKPSPLNLLFKDLSGKLPVIEKEDVFFEAMDFDAY